MPLYIEDVFETIANKLLSYDSRDFNGIVSDTWTKTFISSVFDQMQRGKAFSTEQVKVIIEIIKKTEKFLIEYNDYTSSDLKKLINYPKFRQQPYKSIVIPREVRHMGLNLLGFRFKYNPEIVREFKELQKLSHATPYFDKNFNIWFLPVSRHNIDTAIHIIKEYRFSTDIATDRWLMLAKESHDKASVFEIHEDNIVTARVTDNEILALWMRNSLGAEPI